MQQLVDHGKPQSPRSLEDSRPRMRLVRHGVVTVHRTTVKFNAHVNYFLFKIFTRNIPTGCNICTSCNLKVFFSLHHRTLIAWHFKFPMAATPEHAGYSTRLV